MSKINVFKFGGASVKDSKSVKNVAAILQRFSGQPLVVVVSAMGKTTNALEKVLHAWYKKDGSHIPILKELADYHLDILKSLFPDVEDPVYAYTGKLKEELEKFVAASPSGNYDRDYDQLVSFGELLSTVIIYHYLVNQGFTVKWFDARQLIRTDNSWREGKVDWQISKKLITEQLDEFFMQHTDKQAIALTQGFISGTKDGFTTTLGREGSDYSAAIFSYVLDAEAMTVWKDVPGILSADPKIFGVNYLYEKLSYREAIELTYYGASVIHPKTIKPLQNKGIPLWVKSFLQPGEPGTCISNTGNEGLLQPAIILKTDQMLLSLSPRDFSFIAEENLSEIFTALAASGIRANMMQISALDFSFCMDRNESKMQKLISLLDSKFSCRTNDNLELITIRHYDQPTIDRLLDNKIKKLQQISQKTAQFLVKNKPED